MFTIGQSYQLGDEQFTIAKNLLAEPHHSHEVYLASDSAKQLWVVKFATTPLAVKQLRHEQAILQQLNRSLGTPYTRGVVAVHDSAQKHLLAAHITEYVPHTYTLAHYLQFHPTLVHQAQLLPKIFSWFKQCVDIMTAVHDQGIAHGDLKLQNCVLDAQDQVHVIDWDHGQWLTQSQRPATIEGTPPYMSPEHLHGQAPDPQTDIYTLGMMFLALAYGSVITPLYVWSRPKAERRDKAAVVKAIVVGETAKYYLYPLPRTELEMNLQAIWRRMTEPNRQQRFQTMLEIKTLVDGIIL